MNPLDPFNYVSPYTSQSNPVFEPKFINLDYIFYKWYLFFTGGGTTGIEGGRVTFSMPQWWYKLFGGGSGGGEVAGAHTVSFAMFAGFLKDVFYFMILFLITLIIYCVIRMFEVRKKSAQQFEDELSAHKKKQEATQVVKEAERHISRNEGWVKVLKNLDSQNEGDWRMAVIDADKMLDMLTDQLNLPGENLGEKLKAADRERFKSLDKAWSAHNVRNRIAHEGTSFTLTKREADRVIALYEQVFQEFGYI
ncbi:MAG: hypothetical protein ACKOW9_03800 [Candidatus Paceibacterota bacterium]